MDEASPDDAAVSSQNSNGDVGSQQTREQKFYSLYDNHVDGKETHVLTALQYNAVVDALLRCQRKEPLTSKEYNWTKRFTMQFENGQNVLYRKDGKVVMRDGLFKLIQTAHHRTVHGGRDVTYRELNTYGGISKEIISLYLSLCRECELKKAKVRKSVVVKPLLSEDFNSRCQVDLIDLQSRTGDNYNFLMVYQDHLTKFVVLRALGRKTAIEVAGKLKEIFAVFGAPRILQSDNGKEFANQVVKELVRQWPECRIVHGKPRHSQSQGSVERANRDVGDMLTMYLKDNKTTRWAAALPVIQAAKNRRFHRGINMSPFEAMFGKRMEPSESEEDLNGEDWGTDVEDRYIPSEDKENSSEDRSAWDSDDEADLSEAAQLHHRAMRIVQQREEARVGQKRQAESMLQSSAKRHAPVEVGTSVRVPVPDVDRLKIDHRNVVGVVVSVEDGGLYKIGTSTGVLDRSYARNQFDPCAQSFLMVDDVPQKEVALRPAAGADSLGGT